MDATIGISTASATICSIVRLEQADHGARREAVTRLTKSQGKRLRDVVEDGVRDLLVADAAERLDVLVGLLLDDVDDVVDGEHADEPLVSSTTAAETRL